jgi:ABC-type nickel/cobalt efflux system permease component RcnA/ABC-type uncharacterized transport system substrate-binding protein
MIRIIFLTLLFTNLINACSLCAVYSPRTDVAIHIKADKEEIKTAKVTWTFAAAFSDELLKLYDLNLDETFDEKELTMIEDALLAYIETKNFLTFISYDKDIQKESRKVDVTKYKFSFDGKSLSFDYEIRLNYKIIDKNKLHIRIHDDGAYFLILFDKKKQFFNIPYKVKKEYKPNNITYTIDAPSLANNIITKDENVKSIEEPTLEEKLTVEEKKKELTFLEKYTKEIKRYLIEIEKGEDKLALVFLLFASFIYGVIHALGPGHGKALAFSYFSAQKSSFIQAFSISLATAFVHIIGAFILVVVSVFVLQSVLNSFIEDSISYLTSLCAVLIMILSLYILYKKLKKKSCACCKRKNQDLLFVLTAGLIPCPGTVLLFVYAFILKTYLSVILASIAISLGMAIVIFASSFLGLSLNKFSRKSHSFTNALEIFAPIFMFFLGLLLLLSAV